MSNEGSIVFDRAAGFYDETRGFPPGEEQHVADLFVKTGALNAQSQLLEVGIGTGRIALPLAPRVGACYGVDLSLPMMERLREKQNGEPVYPVYADATKLPFPANRFDAVVAVHVFHLIPGWRTVLAEIARVLRPGGRLLHGNNWINGGFDPLYEALNAAVPADNSEYVGVPRDQRLTFLENAGWQLESEPQQHPFAHYRSPQSFLDRLVERSWSSTWRWSDDVLARALEAVKSAIAENYGDPHQKIRLDSAFELRSYLPPPSEPQQ